MYIYTHCNTVLQYEDIFNIVYPYSMENPLS